MLAYVNVSSGKHWRAHKARVSSVDRMPWRVYVVCVCIMNGEG